MSEERLRQELKRLKEEEGRTYIKCKQLDIDMSTKEAAYWMAKLEENGDVEKWSNNTTWKIAL